MILGRLKNSKVKTPYLNRESGVEAVGWCLKSPPSGSNCLPKAMSLGVLAVILEKRFFSENQHRLSWGLGNSTKQS